MNRDVLERLERIVGPEHVTSAPEELLCYAYDGSALEFPPAAVAFPATTAEVSGIMALASTVPFPVVPRGAGSGMTGGALPVAGGLLLATSRLNRILEIDTENRLAVAQPGVITGQLRQEAARHGLFYPPDPASLGFCTLGGNVAEGAGGPSAVKYGVTRDYVRGLEVVLPDGRILQTGVRTAKGVVGYDLTRLFVGSEGTLGVITKIIVRLIGRPEAKSTFLVLARELAQATGLVSRLLAAALLPCTLEYMDRTALNIAAAHLPQPLPPEAQALLLVELDGDKECVAVQEKKLLRFLERENLLLVRRAETPEEVELLWAARRRVSPAAFQLKPHKMGEDVVVPCSRIPELVAFTERLQQGREIVVFTFGHAGDGNIHVNIMLDRENPREVQEAEQAKQQLFEKVLQLGGTLSGEHGIGLTKSAYLGMELDPTSLLVMQDLKNLFDPKGILNPGKIFPTALPEKSD